MPDIFSDLICNLKTSLSSSRVYGEKGEIIPDKEDVGFRA
jgi:hypothetical protein